MVQRWLFIAPDGAKNCSNGGQKGITSGQKAVQKSCRPSYKCVKTLKIRSGHFQTHPLTAHFHRLKGRFWPFLSETSDKAWSQKDPERVINSLPLCPSPPTLSVLSEVTPGGMGLLQRWPTPRHHWCSGAGGFQRHLLAFRGVEKLHKMVEWWCCGPETVVWCCVGRRSQCTPKSLKSGWNRWKQAAKRGDTALPRLKGHRLMIAMQTNCCAHFETSTFVTFEW